jgi:opacity protein-like surface antigen
MKKILAVALLGLAGLANAGSLLVETAQIDGITRANSTGYLIQVSEEIAKNVDASAQILTYQTDGTNSVSSRYELGLSPKYKLGSATLYTKFALGQKLSSTGNKDFYGIEPGVIVPFAERWNVRFGYRMRNGYDGSTGERTNTARLGLGYDLTKVDSINIRYDRQRGDLEQNSWNLAYIRRF